MPYTDDDCSICRETYQTADDRVFLTCSHAFHIHCINKWLLRGNTCPICRERIGNGDEEESGNDSENNEQEFVERFDGVRVPRYIGGLRYHQNLNEYISPEEGVMMYNSVEFTSHYPELEVLNGGKCIRNSGFNFWTNRLEVLNGVTGRVPVRFLGSFDTEIEIQYIIKKHMEIGTIIFQTGFLPTQYMDKDRFIYDKGLAITALVRENNEVRLVISYFGTSMKEERISDNRRGTTFVGKLILRKLKQNISVYLKVDNSEGIYREKQARYFSTDLPNIPAPDGIYMHTFDNIDNYYADLWPVFNVCNESNAYVVMSSKHIHEPSCNKNLFMSENGHSVSNSKQKGFVKCALKSRHTESESLKPIFVQSKHDLFYPFLKKYNFSFELDFAKSLYSEEERSFLIQIHIQSPENNFMIGVGALEDQISVYVYNGDSTPKEQIFFRSSHSLKKLHFSIEVNYELHTIKLDILYPAKNKRYTHEFMRYTHEFMNTVYTETPYLYVGMRNTGVIEACFS